MKKTLCALVALAIMLCGFAMAEAIHPMDNAPDLNNGTYPAAFKQDQLADGTVKEMHIYTIDRYAKDDIANVAVGDTLFIEGKEVAITAVEWQDKETVLINGGYDNGGYTIEWYDPDPDFEEPNIFNAWMSVADNDYHTFTEYGVGDYEMDPAITFVDSWDIDAKPVTVTGAEEVAKAIAAADGPSFFEYNTEVTLKDGRIVEIHRDFIP